MPGLPSLNFAKFAPIHEFFVTGPDAQPRPTPLLMPTLSNNQSWHLPTRRRAPGPGSSSRISRRAHGEAFRQSHVLSPEQRAALSAIERCRTAALGGHLEACTACGHEHPSCNSCRNRHCPKCQALAQARWIEGRLERLLPVQYVHVVFTLPSELRALAMRDRVTVFELLFLRARPRRFSRSGVIRSASARSSASPWCFTPGRAPFASIKRYRTW
jgi:hypothetical protein